MGGQQECEACNPPYSANNAISARGDLNDPNGTYPFDFIGYGMFGGMDMKATSYELSKRHEITGISGPTWDDQPPFQWSKMTAEEQEKAPHIGHPDLWNFGPVTHQWSLPSF